MKEEECDNDAILALAEFLFLCLEQSSTSWAKMANFLMRIDVNISLVDKYLTLKSLTQKGRREQPRQQQWQRVNQIHPRKPKTLINNK